MSVQTEGPPRPMEALSLIGTCPRCGDVLVSETEYIAPRGYVARWVCAASRDRNPTCSFWRLL